MDYLNYRTYLRDNFAHGIDFGYITTPPTGDNTMQVNICEDCGSKPEFYHCGHYWQSRCECGKDSKGSGVWKLDAARKRWNEEFCKSKKDPRIAKLNELQSKVDELRREIEKDAK